MPPLSAALKVRVASVVAGRPNASILPNGNGVSSNNPVEVRNHGRENDQQPEMDIITFPLTRCTRQNGVSLLIGVAQNVRHRAEGSCGAASSGTVDRSATGQSAAKFCTRRCRDHDFDRPSLAIPLPDPFLLGPYRLGRSPKGPRSSCPKAASTLRV